MFYFNFSRLLSFAILVRLVTSYNLRLFILNHLVYSQVPVSIFALFMYTQVTSECHSLSLYAVTAFWVTTQQEKLCAKKVRKKETDKQTSKKKTKKKKKNKKKIEGGGGGGVLHGADKIFCLKSLESQLPGTLEATIGRL